jgi:hypothetical protein
MRQLHDALITVYSSFGSSLDRIASSSSLRDDFRLKLPEPFQSIGDDELVHHLLNLRKRGKLPRTRPQAVSGGK